MLKALNLRFKNFKQNSIPFIWKSDAEFLFESYWICFPFRKLLNLYLTVWETENQKLLIYALPKGS